MLRDVLEWRFADAFLGSCEYSPAPQERLASGSSFSFMSRIAGDQRGLVLRLDVTIRRDVIQGHADDGPIRARLVYEPQHHRTAAHQRREGHERNTTTLANTGQPF